ncbi:MAG: DUF2318 domain-containing protein [Acidobacteriota bacterium]
MAATATGAYFLGGSLAEQSAPLAREAAAPTSGEPDKDGHILIPISEVSSGQARFFDYRTADNTLVRFFVMKSSDGVYRAALDTCDVCYAAKKGYHQDGDDMVCRKCRRRFSSAFINEVSGGCNPVGVPRTVEGDSLVIKSSDLEAGKVYF